MKKRKNSYNFNSLNHRRIFLVKSIKSDSIALSNNNILNETKKEDKINNVVQYQRR